MLKKRLIGVVTVKNEWAVQSFGYSKYLPLGKTKCLVENLDRWGADEILVQVIDRSIKNFGPDFSLLEQLGKIGLETPLIYAGGIKSVTDGLKAIQLGADRIVIDSLIHLDLSIIRELSEKLGAQALIASLPLSWQTNNLMWLDYKKNILKPLPEKVLELISLGIVSEVLITDYCHEGLPGNFEQKLIQEFPLKKIPIIAFGGINTCEQMRELLYFDNIAAIAVGNFLSYKEHAIQKYKMALNGLPLRHPIYESIYSHLTNV